MAEDTYEIKAPVAWLPAGLITWYAPGGAALALVTSWVALIGGKHPRMRTAWHGNHDPLSRFWSGGDFVYNVPQADCLEGIRDAMKLGRLCLYAETDLGFQCTSGIASVAPRLLDCLVQVECINGKLMESGTETELCGDVVRLHRDQVTINPNDIPDLCAIQPLSFSE